MSRESEAVDAYLHTINRIEPEVAMIDDGAGWASIAISLKRIADALESIEHKLPHYSQPEENENAEEDQAEADSQDDGQGQEGAQDRAGARGGS